MGMVAVHPRANTVQKTGRQWAARREAWLAGYRRRSMSTDAAIVVFAVTAAHVIRVDSGFRFSLSTPTQSGEWVLGIAVLVAWVLSLAIEGAWNREVLGAGGPEYRRILVASLVLFSVVGIVGYLTLADLARGYLLVALPIGVAGLLLAHWVRRRTLADAGRRPVPDPW